MPTYVYHPIHPPQNRIKANKVQCKSIPATRPNTNSITPQTLDVLLTNRSKESIVNGFVYGRGPVSYNCGI